jgi:hypothetical protein
MMVAGEFAQSTLEQIKEACAGGTMLVYSVARPITPEKAVDRSGLLATFTFQTPAFGEAKDGLETPLFVESTVAGHHVGTPGFVRLSKADGSTIADLSAGPGPREVKFTEISVTGGSPVKVATFKFNPEGGWPERPDFYDTRPRPGFPLPKAPD